MTLDPRLTIARAIVDFEARRDRAGHLAIYKLPANDGGGAYEVAGICERYHPHEAQDLAALIKAGKFTEAEDRAAEYIATYTDCVLAWRSSMPLFTGLPFEAFMRDCVFNRGARGAAKILQIALDVPVDGVVGPKTRAALHRVWGAQDKLVDKLRLAREYYEKQYVGYRANFWKGLVNRWDSAARLAKSFCNPKGD